MQDESQPASDSAATAVLAALRTSVGSDMGPIERGQSLADDLRLDSLEFVALVQDIEDRLGISLDEKKVAAVGTVADLIELVDRACAAKSDNR